MIVLYKTPYFLDLGQYVAFFGPRNYYPGFQRDNIMTNTKLFYILVTEGQWVMLKIEAQQNVNPMKKYRRLKSRPTLIFPFFDFTRPGN